VVLHTGHVNCCIDNLLPFAGLSVLMAKPKVGKSVIARQMGVSVSTGRDFWGRKTTQGKVLYIALEEQQDDIRRHFDEMGCPVESDNNIILHTGAVDKLSALKASAARNVCNAASSGVSRLKCTARKNGCKSRRWGSY
jgi:hypothetical protein